MRHLLLSALLVLSAPISALAGPWLSFPNTGFSWMYPTYFGSDGFHLEWNGTARVETYEPPLTIVQYAEGTISYRVDAPFVSMTMPGPDTSYYEFGAGTITVDFNLGTPLGFMAATFTGNTKPFSFYLDETDSPVGGFPGVFFTSPEIYNGRLSPNFAHAFGISKYQPNADFDAQVEQIEGEPGDAARLANSSVSLSILVPEPATVALLGLGAVALRVRKAGARWRRSPRG